MQLTFSPNTNNYNKVNFSVIIFSEAISLKYIQIACYHGESWSNATEDTTVAVALQFQQHKKLFSH